MTHHSARPVSRWLAGDAADLSILVIGPAAALAHADLVTSDPANGTTLTASPATITATYAEAFDTKRSSMELLGPDGATLATNEPATAATAESMTISGFGTLAPGTYSVRWTTITPDDNGIERGTFRFTITTTTASPSPTAGSGASSGGAGDIALPLVALGVLLAGGLAWFLRR